MVHSPGRVTRKGAAVVYFSQLMLGDRRPQLSGHERYEQLMDEVLLLEQLGNYDAVWFAEHHFTGYALIPSCLMMAAAAARETRRIRLGAGVVVLPFHHPVRVVEEAAMVDCLSGGRLELGLGRGYQPQEFRGYGQTVEDSPERFAQALKVVVDMLSDPQGPGHYDTPLFHGQDATFWPKPVQRPIPFWGASLSEASFTRYADLCWPILTFPANQDPVNFKRQLDLYRDRYRAAGHDPAKMRIAMTMFAYLEEDHDSANRTFEAAMTHYFGFLHKITSGAESLQQSFYTEIPTLARLSGNPEDVRNRLRELIDEYGVTDFINATHYAGYLSPEQTLRSMRLFSEQVIPAFEPVGATR
jgi:alkanesulfonate monooxygenase SsuD/methylene tetrahydromethanopterin reductase-like flavin-dependent oxidoreductase (luciferase family)